MDAIEIDARAGRQPQARLDGGHVVVDQEADLGVDQLEAAEQVHAVAVVSRAADDVRVVGPQRLELAIPPRVRLDQQQDVGFDAANEIEEGPGLIIVDQDVRHQQADAGALGALRDGFGLRRRGRSVGPDAVELPGEGGGKGGEEEQDRTTPCTDDEGGRQQDQRQNDGELDAREIPDPDPPFVARYKRKQRQRHRRRAGREHRPAHHPAAHPSP